VITQSGNFWIQSYFQENISYILTKISHLILLRERVNCLRHLGFSWWWKFKSLSSGL